jgi:Na+/melibiose symporter-like transporter
MRNKKAQKSLTAGEFKGNKIPPKTLWIYSLSGIFRDSCLVLVSNYYLSYAKAAGLLDKDQYLPQLIALFIIYAVTLIWDMFNEPLMGILIEKCHFKTGKYRPWILIGAILNTAMVLLMFLFKPKGWAFVASFGAFYFLWDFVFTMNDLAYWAMLPSLTSDGKERTKLTTLASAASGLGQAAMLGAVSLVVEGSNLSEAYGWIAIPSALLFLASQACIFFFCQEHKQDPKQIEVSSKTRIRDIFGILQKNKPLRMVVWAVLFDFLMGAIVATLGSDYFVFTYGFGGKLGGLVFVVNGIFSAVGSVVGQFMFPFMSKKMKLMDIVKINFFLAIACYLVLYFVSVPLFGDHPLAYAPTYTDASGVSTLDPFGGTIWILFIPNFFVSLANSLFYLVLIVMMQNAIDYNEYAFGERKEAMAFAWKPLASKISAALKWALYILVLFSTGTWAYYWSLNETSAAVNAGEITAAEAEAEVMSNLSKITKADLIGYDTWYIGLAIVFLTAAYLFIRFGYKLSDEEHRAIVQELSRRHNQNEAVLAPVKKNQRIRIKR